MDRVVLVEMFGYVGSALVVISMLMSSVIKLRVINAIGSIISGTYAIICGALPLFLMNAALIIINGFNLYKLLKTEKNYHLVDCAVDDAGVGYFVEYFKEDIQTYFPCFQMNTSELDQAYMIYCESAPAGILLGKQKGKGIIDVALEYTTPVYRDCSVAKHLYSELPSRGVKTLVFSQKVSHMHKEFMIKMGFVKENNMFVKNFN